MTMTKKGNGENRLGQDERRDGKVQLGFLVMQVKLKDVGVVIVFSNSKER
jgi:hypothetical protein